MRDAGRLVPPGVPAGRWFGGVAEPLAAFSGAVESGRAGRLTTPGLRRRREARLPAEEGEQVAPAHDPELLYHQVGGVHDPVQDQAAREEAAPDDGERPAPGSAWIIDLGGERIPCDRIEVDIADSEFARDIQIQYELPKEPGGRMVFEFVALSESFWQQGR